MTCFAYMCVECGWCWRSWLSILEIHLGVHLPSPAFTLSPPTSTWPLFCFFFSRRVAMGRTWGRLSIYCPPVGITDWQDFLCWYWLQCIAMARVWIWKIPNIDLFGFWISFPPIVIIIPLAWSFVRNQDLVFTARILNRHLFRNRPYFSLFSQPSVDMKKWKWEPKNICFRINQRCVHCALSYQDLHSSIFMRKIPRVV